jgi:hypothetical protein
MPTPQHLAERLRALATAEAARLEAEAQAARTARQHDRAAGLAAQATQMYAKKRRIAAAISAGGREAKLQYEESVGGHAWSSLK